MPDPAVELATHSDATANGEQALSVVLGGNDLATMARVRRALEHDGFTVVARAHTANEAVDAAMRHRPHVCLLDAEVAGDGIAATRQISLSLPDTRVALLATSASEDDVFRAVCAGADGYLLRTTAQERVAPALRAVVRGEPALPRSVTAIFVQQLRDSSRGDRERGRGRIGARLLYGPRFARHFYRRIRSDMAPSDAWHATRARMQSYR